MALVTEIYSTALKHHRMGEVNRAEKLCRELLRVDPNHADANNLLGVLRAGDPPRSLGGVVSQ